MLEMLGWLLIVILIGSTIYSTLLYLIDSRLNSNYTETFDNQQAINRMQISHITHINHLIEINERDVKSRIFLSQILKVSIVIFIIFLLK